VDTSIQDRHLWIWIWMENFIFTATLVITLQKPITAFPRISPTPLQDYPDARFTLRPLQPPSIFFRSAAP